MHEVTLLQISMFIPINDKCTIVYGFYIVGTLVVKGLNLFALNFNIAKKGFYKVLPVAKIGTSPTRKNSFFH